MYFLAAVWLPCVPLDFVARAHLIDSPGVELGVHMKKSVGGSILLGSSERALL